MKFNEPAMEYIYRKKRMKRTPAKKKRPAPRGVERVIRATMPVLRQADPAARYYWAYGSNLNLEQMRRRCPRADPVCALPVRDGTLVFRGVADVVGMAGGIVQGGLWRITAECERALDQYEGVSFKMYSKRHFPISVRGEEVDCLFYKMNSHGIYPPSEGYLAGIVRGYRDFGLDTANLEEALEHAWSGKKKTPDMRRRRARAKYPSLARELPEIDWAEEERREREERESALKESWPDDPSDHDPMMRHPNITLTEWLWHVEDTLGGIDEYWDDFARMFEVDKLTPAEAVRRWVSEEEVCD